MTRVKVELASSLTNLSTSYTQLIGVTQVKLSQASQSTPSSLEVYAVVDPQRDPDDKNSNTPGRIVPGQQIRFSIRDNDYANGQGRDYYLFIGRIDTAEQIDSPTSDPVSLANGGTGTRQWKITARDWLAVLADNYVQKGRWRSHDVAGRNVTFSADAAWDGNYVGDYTGSRPQAPGEKRIWIICDLILNIVNLDHFGLDNFGNGLMGFQFSERQQPNSKPIMRNLSHMTQTSLLDAVRDLARSDPWNTAVQETDGYDISAAAFPSTAGFGAEVRIADPNLYPQAIPGTNGRLIDYYKHGDVDSLFIYGYPPIITTSVISIITEYDFNRQGLDAPSRVRPAGQFGAYERPDENTSGGGGGVVIPFSESIWDPLKGNLARRSELLSYSDALVGDWLYEDQRGNEQDAIQARDQRDTAYADLVTGQVALLAFRGGLNQGRVTIVGPPTNTNGVAKGPPDYEGAITRVLRPGEKLQITIPQLGLTLTNANTEYLCQTWTYTWPDDRTQIDVTRVPFTAIGKQLTDLQRRVNDAITSRSKAYISDWRVVDPTGTMTWHHGLGTKPSHIQVEVADWDGRAHVAGSDIIPLPKSQTYTIVPAHNFDPGDGQHFGYVISTLNEQGVTLLLSYWIAYSDGAAKYFTTADATAVLRIKVYP